MDKLTYEQLELARCNTKYKDITNYDRECISRDDIIECAQQCFNTYDKEIQIDAFSEFLTNCEAFRSLFVDAKWHAYLDEYLLRCFESQIIEHLNSEFDKYGKEYAEEQNNTHHSGE